MSFSLLSPNAYQHLHPNVQKWVYQQGWTDLNDIQQQAIVPILTAQEDIIISAATAAGKTEAFFLPACSAIADQQAGFGIMYVSPLKALINDQYRRLESLCDLLDMQLTPWHGETKPGHKRLAKQQPSGILLITPESLESLLMREPEWMQRACQTLRYVAIDEFHTFIGTERGYQLLSLLNRLEHLLERYQRPIARVALSATLGELNTVPQLLRPKQNFPCRLITSRQTHTALKVQVQGYIEPRNKSAQVAQDEQAQQHPPEHDVQRSAESQMCQALYTLCRGGSHLIFANSRQRTEAIAARLSDLCRQHHVPNEFFPHHGSLDKTLRETLETRLQTQHLPTTAVCTMTLELGIDIGKVNSVAQVATPHSVASLRQRIGRSGRRHMPAILRMLIAEDELRPNAHLVDKLRLELLQAIAMLRLIITRQWYEPADTAHLHFSTLLQQIFAFIMQSQGTTAEQLYRILCHTGPFQHVSVAHFKRLLTHLGQTDLIMPLSNGELVLGPAGERIANHHTFYAVFNVVQEFRIVTAKRTLGTVPMDSLLVPGQHIIFGGRRWQVVDIDTRKKTILVQAATSGDPPHFSGRGMSVHDVVRQQMYTIYCKGDYRIAVGDNRIDFIDTTANALFQEGLQFFQAAQLDSTHLLQHDDMVYLIPWLGDKVVNTLVLLLKLAGYSANAYAGVVEIADTSVEDVQAYLLGLLQQRLPSPAELAALVPEQSLDRYDDLLPADLLAEGYGARAFDIAGVMDWLKKVEASFQQG